MNDLILVVFPEGGFTGSSTGATMLAKPRCNVRPPFESREVVQLRLTARAVVASIIATSGLLFFGAPTAQACGLPNTSHCYGQANWSHSNHGSHVTLRVACIYTPGQSSGGHFITDELWVGSSQGWIESGMIYGRDSDSRYWFWADARPGGSFNFHPRYDRPANLNTDYDINIEHAATGSSTWYVYQNHTWIGSSTSQFTTAASYMNTGSETTNDNSRTDSVSKVMQWRGASGSYNLSWEDGASHAGTLATGTYAATWNIQYSKISYNVHKSSC